MLIISHKLIFIEGKTRLRYYAQLCAEVQECLQQQSFVLRISPYSVRMRENAGKMRNRITPINFTE